MPNFIVPDVFRPAMLFNLRRAASEKPDSTAHWVPVPLLRVLDGEAPVTGFQQDFLAYIRERGWDTRTRLYAGYGNRRDTVTHHLLAGGDRNGAVPCEVREFVAARPRRPVMARPIPG